MDIFEETKQRVEDISIAERVKRCEWDDPVEVALYVKTMRNSERTRILDKLVPNRHCPSCGCLRIHSRSWVISKDGSMAICRGCFQRHLPNVGVREEKELNFQVFISRQIRYTIAPQSITHARVAASISVVEFARQAGWTTTYQYKLESGEVKSVTAEVAETLVEVFARFGFYTKDQL